METYQAWKLRKILNAPLTPEEEPEYEQNFLPWDEWDEEDQRVTLEDLANVKKLLHVPEMIEALKVARKQLGQGAVFFKSEPTEQRKAWEQVHSLLIRLGEP